MYESLAAHGLWVGRLDDLFPVSRTADGGGGNLEAAVVLQVPGNCVAAGVAFEGVAGNQPRYPALGDPVVAGDLGLVAAFDEYGGDDRAGFRHPWKSGRSAIPMS